ncbi:MAG TPA: NAD(P)/FAD-dependent oxidoreductase [Clostridiales bacterium]|nr:NAD(P)/FAD-dependent oxidoreductase [Clostridiales bacterium]
MKHYVIIGNGVAAVGCIEGIRSLDKNAKITVISEENRAVYSRPLISYYLEDKTDLERINYRSPDFYDKMGCEVLYGKKAVRLYCNLKNDIDSDLVTNNQKKVVVSDGTVLDYTSVCVATGSVPFIPNIEGLDEVKDKFCFMTLDDAEALKSAVNSKSRVLIIGAGLIGLKCAEGLHNRVASITVCDLADRVLSSVLEDDGAAIMKRHLETNGIKFMLSDTVMQFKKHTAIMKSGRQVEFDVLVLASGVRPNTGLIKDAGGEVNRGIIVNDRMQTSLADVYAAGDCTEGNDVSFGGRRVLALLPNAYMQGFTAGVNMAGGNEVYDKAIAMNSVGFFGLHAMTAGVYNGEIYEEKDESSLKRLFVKDGYLVGFIIVGRVERAGIYTSLIRERTPLSEIGFDILKKDATTAAFPSNVRRKMFEGVV